MRVYIPFGDGSSVSFDGEGFTVHRRPVDIDADLNAPAISKAEEAWQKDWGALVRALQSAWVRERDARKREGARQTYNNLNSKAKPKE